MADMAGFGEYAHCCASCAWNEWRYMHFVNRGIPREEQNAGRQWWCLLRQTPLPESAISSVVCNEYQQAVAGLGLCPLEAIRSLPDHELWAVFGERQKGEWSRAKVPPPVRDPLQGLRRA